ncbi:DUF4367 domain-containing protein [Desulfitobacterium sp. THU1]|uniref:DUF4367 domain-containing protein n=1 Tax=Desulfitobacterium sp. THU1 TaxID=3138072 RepID=UPI00311E7BBF
MADNRPEQNRKKLYEDYEDSLFRLILDEAADKEGKGYLEEMERLKNDPEYLPSREAFGKFTLELDNYYKKANTPLRKRRVSRVLNRVAIAMLIVIALLFSTVASVQALRARVLNFFINIQQDHTSFQIKESNNSASEGAPVVDWTKAYVPTYIPEGYEVKNISSSSLVKTITFTNQQNSIISYTELSEDSAPALDTENVDNFESIDINGHQGNIIVKNSLVTLIWEMDGRMFLIQSQTSEDITIKIAQNVRFVE